MAKIKLSGFQELIDIQLGKAKQIQKIWADDSVPRDKKITVDNYSFTKGDIKAILLDAQQVEDLTYTNHLKDFYAIRDRLLQLSPRERAEKTAWGPFKLFYWGIFRKNAPESMKERAIQEATDFFTANPEWSRPSMKCWFRVLEIESKRPMDTSTYRVLEKGEESEMKDIEQSEDYEKKQHINSKEEEAVLKVVEKELEGEINPEDIPF